MKSGYPPAVIRKEDRLTYYDALDEACVSGNYDAITHLVADATSASGNLSWPIASSARVRASGCNR
jgi:hypothetical protein